MTRLAYLSCSAGVAGDMVLGALLDAGADLEQVRAQLSTLGMPGWSLEAEATSRGGISATRAVVGVEDDATSRAHAEIRAMIIEAPLAPRVRERSLRAFHLLAAAEAQLHGIAVDQVHFHEVGGHDAIIDVVGTMAALELLGIDEVRCGVVGLGAGVVRSAHGLLSAPTPATASLLRGFLVEGVDLDLETATPTGAALLAALCPGPGAVPSFVVEAQGFGAGSRDPDGLANVVGVLIGERAEEHEDQVALLETNLDDVTGEQLGLALSSLMAEGALDAWATPVTMKKGRPGHVLSVLAKPYAARRLAEAISRHTGSLGVRTSLVPRLVQERRTQVVDVLGHKVRVKVSAVGAKPEFDDLVAVAEATHHSVAEIEALVRRALL
jgi:pyridinium-3,5-bisthiocarboxylic acid mononucleotide nickel chelatase